MIRTQLVIGILLLAGVAQAANLSWNGTQDSNWDVAGNWNSGVVPGSTTVDNAILSGVGDAVVAATPVGATNLYTVKIYNEASLRISADMTKFNDIILGSVAGAGGGHITQPPSISYHMVADQNVIVDDDLRVGSNTNATSDSSYSIAGGTLTVMDEIYVNQGRFKVDGPDSTISAERMTLTANAELHFDFDLEGVSPIVVNDEFKVASGASLTFDLRGYTMGGNVIELVQFGSMSGSFDPADITIVGLAGGTVSVDEDSLNLTVVDEVHEASKLWLVASGGTGSEPTDLKVNTGRLFRDLSSTSMSYSQVIDGNDVVSSMMWSGSDFNGDGFNDIISCDVRVEGFTGSTYVYSENELASSMTALGTPAAVVSYGGAWGVGSDGDLDAGESLRVTVENIYVSEGISSDVFDGFAALATAEPNGGNTHKVIVGMGEGLEALASNGGETLGLSLTDQVIVTSAASSRVALGNVALQCAVGEPLDVLDTEANDYSGRKSGPSYRADYAATQDFSNFPEYSWDRVQRVGLARKTTPLTDEEIQLLAASVQLVNISTVNQYADGGYEAGALDTARRLKTANPNITCFSYMNSSIKLANWAANELFEPQWEPYSLDENGDIVYATNRGYDFNYEYPEMRQWWIDAILATVNDPSVDGVFLDSAGSIGEAYLNEDGDVEPANGILQMYYELSQQVPPGTLLFANSLRNARPSGGRDLMHFLQGSYLESWEGASGSSPVKQSHLEAIDTSLQLMREAALKGKIVTPNWGKTLGDKTYIVEQIDAGNVEAAKAEIREHVVLPLAYHLIIAEKYTYLSYRYGDVGTDPVRWYLDYVDELNSPTGAPLGPPVKDGTIYTRSYEYVDVWLNVETDEAELVWDSVDSDSDGMSDLWEYRNFGGVTNAVATANPDDDAYSNLEEYIAGLNPNVFDTFAVSDYTVGASNTFEWNVASNRVYNVYWSSNLLDGFSLIESNALGGVFIDMGHADESSGFYKITVELEP